MKVLIVEDDEVSSQMLQAVLAKRGYESMVARDGQEAWDLLQKPDCPKLVILDRMMPRMDGLEVCRRVRAVSRAEPPYEPPYIIMLTVLGDTADVIAGLEAGANDYIGKPFDVGELRARVEVGRRVVELQAALARQIKELREAFAHIQTLQGLIPICSYCRKVRGDQDYWEQLEAYIVEHSEAVFTHGVCPDCYQKHLVPQLEEERRKRQAVAPQTLPG